MAVRKLIHEDGSGASQPPYGPEIVRARSAVRCTDGTLRASRYLDYAATAPALRAAADAALEVLPYYGSIHRGAGAEASTSTAAYEHARSAVGLPRRGARPPRRLRARHDRGAERARALPAGTRRRALDARRASREHAPLRRREVDLLPFTRSADELLSRTDAALTASRYDLLAVSGASNVTGEIMPLRRARRARAPPRGRDLRGRGPTRPARADRHACARHRSPRALRPQALRALRRRRARRPWAPHRHCGAAPTAAAPWRACSTTASSGATRRRASRPAPPTSSAPSPSARPARRCAAYGMGLLAAEELDPRRAAARSGLAAVPGVRVLAQWAEATPPARRARVLPRRRASRRARSRAGWPRSTRSRCARARSARTRCVRHLRAAVPRRGRRAPCARASASAPGIDDIDAARRARWARCSRAARQAAPAGRAPWRAWPRRSPASAPLARALTTLRTRTSGRRAAGCVYAPGRTRTCPLHIRRG